jgi:hypothetical protein
LDSAKRASLEMDRAVLTPEVEEFTKSLCNGLSRASNVTQRAILLSRLKEQMHGTSGPASVSKLRSKLLCYVFLDLCHQGWSIKLGRNRLQMFSGDTTGESPETAKQRIREQHLQERDAQLREPSVRDFIKQMERRRLTSTGWHSIFSVMRDGPELAASLRKAHSIVDPFERQAALSRCIDPYLQLVDNKSVCSQTGLRLNDIWRYFRHTWTNSYRSTPGRSMAILVRDRSVPNHPIIGIAALGSSVVQQSVRDSWIAWDAKGIIDQFCLNPTRAKVRWLQDRIEEQIGALYVRDLVRDGLVTRAQIKRPTEEVFKTLLAESEKSIKTHRLYPDKTQLKETTRGEDWKLTAETTLFRSKRCKQLATLLSIRLTFQECALDQVASKDLLSTMQNTRVRRAVTQICRTLKGERVGISMMDITVCGAVAPYNSILGGKLVCMLLCSSEIVRLYKERYRKQVSVIASAMAGREVTRIPRLVLLCTTSLYGRGSSQYNRIKIPAAVFSGEATGDLRYNELGMSEGFGSFHFSKETIRAADALLGRLEHGRKVNSIFGEGVNPLMRKMREALTEVGLPSELLLKHGNRRIVYGVPLAENFREVLIGLSNRPTYFLPVKDAVEVTRKLGRFWQERWLSMRLDNPEIIAEIERHQLSFPICHGAVVDLPPIDSAIEERLSTLLQS